jgi:hypothetical protein
LGLPPVRRCTGRSFLTEPQPEKQKNLGRHGPPGDLVEAQADARLRGFLSTTNGQGRCQNTIAPHRLPQPLLPPCVEGSPGNAARQLHHWGTEGAVWVEPGRGWIPVLAIRSPICRRREGLCPPSISPTARSAAGNCTPPSSVRSAASRLVASTATAAMRPATPGRSRRRRLSIRPRACPLAWCQHADTDQLPAGWCLSSLGWARNCRRASHSTGLGRWPSKPAS